MEWISVNNKLPRQGKKVLVRWIDVAKEKHIDTATLWRYHGEWHFKYYDIDGPNDLDDSQITHWQPLPEPPKP